MENSSTKFALYLKYFSTRLVQTLVQARLGETIPQPCVPSPETRDWFNVRIDEIGEIAAYLKTAVAQYPPSGRITIEFILYTNEGQYLPLEAWILSVSSKTDCNVAMADLYHKMSTLLKSCVVAARMTPMHRLYVKRQDEESFIILYRVHNSSQISDMGQNHKERKLGELVSQYGTINLEVIYRTSMHFDHPDVPDMDSMGIIDGYLKTNDLYSNVGGKLHSSKSMPISPKDREARTKTTSTSGGSQLGSSSPFSTNATPRFKLGQSTSSEDSKESEATNSIEDENKPFLADLRNHSFPFVSLLQSAYSPIDKKNSSADITAAPTPITTDTGSSTEKGSVESLKDEKENENVKPPENENSLSEDSFVQIFEFSPSNSSNNELGELIKQLRVAPEILQSQLTYNICANIEKELDLLSSHQDSFKSFVSHVNSIADNGTN